MDALQRLLLISNSTLYGSGYLDHAEKEILAFLDGKRRVLFVPDAAHDRDATTSMTRKRFAAMGCELVSVHAAGAAFEAADAVFVGGGNTFRLLDRLYRCDLIGSIRRRVAAGMPYIGSSAGSIVACPTLKTTKDMPVVQPPSFEALNLVPFQISPHYLDPDPGSTHMGETQEQRIGHYHEENDLKVVGLREGTMLVVEGRSVMLRGAAAARVFVKGRPPVEYQPGARLDRLME
jgi:dipeptidase E